VSSSLYSLLQSYGTDEVFIKGGAGRLLSMHGSRRRRHRSDCESESSAGALQHQTSIRQASIQRQASVQRQASIQRQASVQRQTSVGAKPDLKRQVSEKQQEKWDKETPVVPLTRVIAVNAKEWWMIVLGLFGAAINGCIFPAFALIFGVIVGVFALPPERVQSEMNLYAGLFLVLGSVSATGVFLKVRPHVKTIL